MDGSLLGYFEGVTVLGAILGVFVNKGFIEGVVVILVNKMLPVISISFEKRKNG